MSADHYATLGVAPTAPADEVRAAYLRLMRACHPDVRPGDRDAAELARRANVAWQVLGDRDRRASYDRQLRPGAAVDFRPAPRPAGQAVYVERRRSYGRDFHRACLRMAAGVFAVGLLLLAFTTG